jgi:hypothetical protein
VEGISVRIAGTTLFLKKFSGPDIHPLIIYIKRGGQQFDHP